MNDFYRKNRLFFLVLILAVVGFAAWYFVDIIIFVIVAGTLSIIGAPVVEFLDKIRIWKFRIPHTINVVFTLLLFLGLFLGLVSLFIPLIIRETEMISNIDGKALMKFFSKDISCLETYLHRNGVLPKNATIESTVKKTFLQMLDFGLFGNFLTSVLSITGTFFFHLFSITFLTFFFLKDPKMLPGLILRIMPAGYRMVTRTIMHKSRKLLTRYFFGLIVQITANVATYSLAFYIVGVDSPLAIGLFTGVVIIIPYIGGIISMIVGVILGVTGVISMGEYSLIFPVSIKILVAMFIVQTIDNNIFAPLIQGKSVKAHPVEVFLVVIAAATFGGIIGMVVAVPVYGFIKIVTREISGNFTLLQRFKENR